MKRLVSLMLTMVMVITTLFCVPFNAFADSDSNYVGSGRLASNVTIDPDGDYVPEEGEEIPNTTMVWDEATGEYVFSNKDKADNGFGTPASDGRVWANKVLTTDEATGAVQIQLSALGQQYSSVINSFTPGVSNAVDAVLILDVTRSMLYGMSADSTAYPSAKENTRAYNMVSAVNSMVNEVMKANPMNRISIVTFDTDNNYNNTSKVLLPLGSYTQFTAKDILTMSAYSSRNGTGTIRENVSNSTVSIIGGTNGQEGIALGSYQLWKSVANKTDNEVDSNGNRVRRSPFVLYLSDGACNVATTRWYDNNTGTNGNISQTGRFHEATVNNPTNLELARISALTILTAAFQKEKITQAYRAYNADDTINTTWFNIGLAVEDDDNTTNYAKATLSPRWCYEVQKNNTTNNNRVTTQITNYASTATAAGSTANTKFATFPTYQYTKNTFTDDDDKEFIYYANSAEELSSAFDDLGMTIGALSKEVSLPVSQKATKLGVNSAIRFEDKLGDGVEIVGNPVITYEGNDYVLTNDGNGVYSSSVHSEMEFAYNSATRVVTWDVAGKTFPQYTFKNGNDGSDGYNECDPIILKINVAPSSQAIANGQRKFYSNAYEDGVPQAKVIYYPNMDNPFYFKTNEKAGVVTTKDVLDVSESNIDDFYSGEKVGNITAGTVLNNVYFSGEMYLKDEDDLIKENNELGTIIPTLDTTGFSDELLAAVEASIKNCDCAKASDLSNPRTLYAFELGNPEYSKIRELKTVNPTNTYPYIYEDVLSNDGAFSALLGNNALMEPICAITKDAPTTSVSTSTRYYRSTVPYTVTVHNYSKNEITDIKVKDSNTALTLTNDDNGNVHYENGEFSIDSIPANGSCTFGYTMNVTTQKVTNTATVETINKEALLFGASDTANTTVVLSTARTYDVTFKDYDGTTLKVDTVVANGTATAPENPTRPGYTFTGWDKTFDNITANTTVTAKYEQIDYTAKYKFTGTTPDGIEAPETVTVHYGDDATPENTMYPAGKTIVGTKEDVNGTWKFNGWTATKGVESNKVTGNVIYEGTWTFYPAATVAININDEAAPYDEITLVNVNDSTDTFTVSKNASGKFEFDTKEDTTYYILVDNKKVLDKDGNAYTVSAGNETDINYYSVDFYNKDGSVYSKEKYDYDGANNALVIEGTVITNKTSDSYWYTSQTNHDFETKFDFSTPITSKTELYLDKSFTFNYYTTFNYSEPWQINAFCTLKYDGKYIDSYNDKQYSDYKIYFYRADLNEAQPSLDVLKNSEKTTVFSKGDKNIIRNSTTNVGTAVNRIGAGYNDIYIYQMKNPVYVVFEFEYNGVVYTSSVKDRSLYNVNETYIAQADNGYHTTFESKQLDLLAKMRNLYNVVSHVCTSKNDAPKYPHYTQIKDYNLENTEEFVFNTSAAIRNIEPWGYKIESNIQMNDFGISPFALDDEETETEPQAFDFEALDDFGVLVYQSKGSVPDLNTIITSSKTANYSYQDGNIFYEGNEMTAYYFNDIKTTDLENNIYVVSYAVLDGEYSYSEVSNYNYIDIAEEADENWNDISDAIIAFQNALVEYEAIK